MIPHNIPLILKMSPYFLSALYASLWWIYQCPEKEECSSKFKLYNTRFKFMQNSSSHNYINIFLWNVQMVPFSYDIRRVIYMIKIVASWTSEYLCCLTTPGINKVIQRHTWRLYLHKAIYDYYCCIFIYEGENVQFYT